MLQSRRTDQSFDQRGQLVVIRNSIEKLKDVALSTVKGVVNDPGGTAGRALQQAKGALASGRSLAEQVLRTASETVTGRSQTGPPTSAEGSAGKSAEMKTESAPEGVDQPGSDAAHGEAVTPSDVARVVEKKSPAEKAAANGTNSTTTSAAKTAATTPGAKLPPRKTTKKTSAKKTTKKAPAKKTAAKKRPTDES
jgi:hypothetical protein